MLTALEVADKGKVISMLSNPYGIATLFNLNSEETKMVVPISRALIGNRSAVVIKTPKGDDGTPLFIGQFYITIINLSLEVWGWLGIRQVLNRHRFS